jgi:hypothetical protein
VNDGRSTRVFSAGGHTFTCADVIDAARARGDWQVLEAEAIGLLASERELAASGALPSPAQVKAAATSFRYSHNLLSADELEQWLTRRDIGIDEWMGEMRSSLLQPLYDSPTAAPNSAERLYWVHAVCSGKMTAYAQILAEEVAIHLSDQPLTLSADELAALPQKRARFCAARVGESALADAIHSNSVGWTRVDFSTLAHPDEMVVREAALCVRMDGRLLTDVAEDAGVALQDSSILLDDADPSLKSRLLAATVGDIIGPYAAESDHRLVLVVRRASPTSDDLRVRQRAADTIIRRALDAEVNRHVNWHEYV